jgi:hypothetical protein
VDLEAELEALRAALEATTEEGRGTLEPLLAALAVSVLIHRNLRDAASLERLEADLAAVADVAAGTVRRAFAEAGRMQARLLEGEFDELLAEAGEIVAAEHRAVVLERTATVLPEHVQLVDGQRDLSYVPGYAALITDVAVGVGSKEGTESAALLLGAVALAAGRLYKTFVRVSPRKEPRALGARGADHTRRRTLGHRRLSRLRPQRPSAAAKGKNLLCSRQHVFCGIRLWLALAASRYGDSENEICLGSD